VVVTFVILSAGACFVTVSVWLVTKYGLTDVQSAVVAGCLWFVSSILLKLWLPSWSSILEGIVGAVLMHKSFKS